MNDLFSVKKKRKKEKFNFKKSFETLKINSKNNKRKKQQQMVS